MNANVETVAADSLVTLNYALTLADGTVLIGTFDSRPATLRMGQGELAPTLEKCLVGLPVGQRHVFQLESDQAFGPYQPGLQQRIPRDQFPRKTELAEMAILEFTAPQGGTFTGLVREVTDTDALVDFNHPLAGKDVRFEVEVIGITEEGV